MATGERLPGGWMDGARLVNGCVHRPRGDHTAFVHELLAYLERTGFAGSPRVIGLAGDDEVLTFLTGHVPVETAREDIEPIVFSDQGIRSAFELIRELHRRTAQCPLRGEAEVVCHGDLSPWNTVYDSAGATAFIDWDNAAPGSRVDDVGNAAWRYLMLGLPEAPPVETQARWLRIAVSAYGRWDAAALLGHAAAAQRVHLAKFQERQRAGDGRYLRLIELGALQFITGSMTWLDANRQALLEDD